MGNREGAPDRLSPRVRDARSSRERHPPPSAGPHHLPRHEESMTTGRRQERRFRPVPASGPPGFLITPQQPYSGTEPGRLGSRELISVL